MPKEVKISNLAEGIRKLRGGRLNDRALILLIQDAAPMKLSREVIRSVLDGIDGLERAFIRKPQIRSPQ